MATVNQNYPTALDWSSRRAPDGSHDFIVEMMQQNYPEFEDIMFLEGNLPTGHQGTVRTGLPSPSWRRAYSGVGFTKSLTEQVTSPTAIMEDWSRWDEIVADINGNRAETRFNEDVSHLQGMVKEWCSTFWYGDASTSPDEFTGLAPRYPSASSGATASNVVDMGGSSDGDQQSVWFVTYGQNHLHGIYPRGQSGGLMSKDWGLQKVQDSSDGSTQYGAYETQFQMKTGIHQTNWKTTARLANIDTADLIAGNLDSILSAKLIETYGKLEQTFIPSVAAGTRTFIYCRREFATQLHIMQQARYFTDSTSNRTVFNPVQLTPGEWAGRPVSMFMGLPIRVSDSLAATEDDI